MKSDKQSFTIHVVDDDESLRTAVRRLLTAVGYKVELHSSAGDFLLASSRHEAGCLILDVNMPGPSGLQLQVALRQHNDLTPVIFLTGQGDIPMSVQAMKSGAVDFLTKPVQKEALLAAVAQAEAISSQRRSESVSQRELLDRVERLTPREREVFDRASLGRLNKQIAVELGISERTVKFHRAQVMEKLEVESIAELARIAEQLTATRRSAE